MVIDLRLASPFHLHGVGSAFAMKLALCGIETIRDLLEYRDLESLSRISTIPLGILRRVRLKALSLVNNEIIQVKLFEPPSRRLIFLDIETTLYGEMVWLIGFMVDDELVQLYADGYDEESEILREFSVLLKNHGDHVLVTWSGFDTRVLCERMRVHGLRPEPVSSKAHMDLRLELRRSFVFPLGGYGLKKIGSFLGYPFRNPGLNGLIVAHEYMKHIVDGAPLHRRFFEYNEDDVMALPYLMDWAIEEQAASDSLQLRARY